MKLLLFDQNISPRLVERLADLYPAPYTFLLWIWARQWILKSAIRRGHDYMIVTKDADFSELGVVQGFPPKIIWIRRGNCPTQEIE